MKSDRYRWARRVRNSFVGAYTLVEESEDGAYWLFGVHTPVSADELKEMGYKLLDYVELPK